MGDLLGTVRDAATPHYHVYGELGRESVDDIWYLGKEHASEKLVALRLHRIGTLPDGGPDYDLEIAHELDGSVAVGQAQCHHCGAELRRWARFCTQCGGDLSTSTENPSSPGARAALLAEVKSAAAGVYDVLGEMPWAGGVGTVYFAVEKASGRLVRLRLMQQGEGFELGETRVAMPFAEQLTASYVTGEQRIVRRSDEAIPRSELTAGKPAQPGQKRAQSARPEPLAAFARRTLSSMAARETLILRVAVALLVVILLALLVFR